SSRRELRENVVGQLRPRVLGPVAELEVGQAAERDASLGIDPEERAARPEVPERARRVEAPRPVRTLVVAQLEAEAPVVRLLTAEAREDADEPRELDRRRLGQRLRRDETGGEQLGREQSEIVDGAAVPRRGRAVEAAREPERPR